MANSRKSIRLDGNSADLSEITRIASLSQLGEEIVKEVDKATRVVADEGVEKLKKNSQQFKGTGKYAKGWTKKQTGNGYVLYNKIYRLPHLLEKPHPIMAHGRLVAHWEGRPHIKPVEEEVNLKIEKKVEEIINKGIRKV